jgi:predicted helicase
LYDSPLLVDERGSASDAFPPGDRGNRAICLLVGGRQEFSLVASDCVPNFNLYSADSSQYLPFTIFGSDGSPSDNITDWALDLFRKHYQPGRAKKDRAITKEAIFHYVYAVLHDPIYREKYAVNLKREFPRIPFYADFWCWADWGKALMDLHIGFESVAPAKLVRADRADEKARNAGQRPKALLKADKTAGIITLDSETILSGVPKSAWNYILGNRSAIEWILDQYKEKKPKDPTIREKFNTYRFADYKEKVIDLIARVTTVSVETMEIVEAMRVAAR